jgi:hypothetical protein
MLVVWVEVERGWVDEERLIMAASFLFHVPAAISRLYHRRYHGPAGQSKRLSRREAERGREVYVGGNIYFLG